METYIHSQKETFQFMFCVWRNFDLFFLICQFLNFKELTLMRQLNNFFCKTITENAHKLVMSIDFPHPLSLDKKIGEKASFEKFSKMVQSNGYFPICYSLNFSGLSEFTWDLLLCFSNNLHYLSIPSTDYGLHDLFSNNIDVNLSDIKIVNTDAIDSIFKFLEDNFSHEDILLLFNYNNKWISNLIDNMREEIFHMLNNVSDEDFFQKYSWNSKTLLNLETTSDLQIGSQMYLDCVELIRTEIYEIKNNINKSDKIFEWFANAEIDIIDFGTICVPDEIAIKLTKCKKIIIAREDGISSDMIDFLQDYGVEIICNCPKEKYDDDNYSRLSGYDRYSRINSYDRYYDDPYQTYY